MEKADRNTYTSLDFMGWRDNGTLILTPKFQRRGIWKTPARSFLIDTLIRGMPVPPIYLRVTQSEDRTKIVREVIDGQQRISAILDFMDGDYALSPNLGTAHGARKFEKLTIEQQDAITNYSFTCESFPSISDMEVLEIFSRLNMYSVPLTAQELRNGKFFGPFKQSAYELATEHLEYWRAFRIFTETAIARMAEAELVSELMIVELAGFQDKKKSIDDFYAEFDKEFPKRRIIEDRFRSVFDTIGDSVGGMLPFTEFRRVPLFYSLFSAIFHRMYGIPGIPKEKSRTVRVPQAELSNLRDAVLYLSEAILLAKNDERIPTALQRFVKASSGQTDNIKPRRTRFDELYKRAFV